MRNQLPARPNLEQLKKRAKSLLQQLQAGHRGALVRAAEQHPKWQSNTPGHPAWPAFLLADAQLVIAREYGFESWPKLRSHVLALEIAPADQAAIQAIREAAGQGDLRRLETLLDAHPGLINEPGGPGVRTALHQAVFGNTPESVALLLARGADPNIRCEGDNAYPLHFAVEKHNFPIVKLLIEHGADPIGEGDYHELGVLGWACAWDWIDANPKIVNYLLAHGAQHNIFSAVSMGDIASIRKLVAQSPGDLERRMNGTKMRRRPLHLAVIKKQPESLRALLDLGANIEALNEPGFTALDDAAFHAETAMVQILLERGAKVRLPAAIALGRTSDIERLMARDPACLKPGGRWETLIVRAAECCPEQIAGHVIDELIRLGAEVNTRDNPSTSVDSTWGYTPLHAAAFRGNLSAVEALIRHGADVQLRETKWHGTPAGWANYAGHTAVRDRILREPVDVIEALESGLIKRLETILYEDPAALECPFDQYPIYPMYAEGWFTPLAFAVAQGKTGAVRWLLEHGADASLRSPAGVTLHQLAQEKGHEAIANVLRAG